MAPAQSCAKYQYVVTSNGPKILPVEDSSSKDEESPADYNVGGYLPIKVGDVFKNGRYRVVRKLGWGHFSTVWLVKDIQEQRHSALKVVKSAGRYAETARDEIKLLSRVASFSPTHPGRSHIVSFLDSFVNQGPESSHVCIVFEPLGENLLGLIERSKKTGVSKSLIKVIAKQVLLGLQYLHDECDLVHTDIKPENILIAIPDIESHIHAELSTSPTPTSRRVGIPLPTKSRGGVSISHNQQRARRQVQIFSSQPLSSPSRSTINLSQSPRSLNLSLNAQENNNSRASSSLINRLHIARLTSNTTTASGSAKSLSSAASKFTSGLTASAPQPDSRPLDSRLFASVNSSVSKQTPLSPPSTSSSSSSISSTAVSIAGCSSSVISTPPTSLSHSLGIAVAGFMRISNAGDSTADASSLAADKKNRNRSREGIPVKRNGKAKASIEDELDEATSTSWKDGKLGSWGENITPVLSSSYKSPSTTHTKSKLCEVQNSHHSQPRSGLPTSSYWKDLGTSAPAPAVVVSAIAGIDGGDESFEFPPAKATSSETSSATATTARPSRTTTPVHPSSPSKKASSLIKKIALNPLPDDSNQSMKSDPSLVHTIGKSTPSLLSQTAPQRSTSSLIAPPADSQSPPPPTSLLSTHKQSLLVNTSGHLRWTTNTNINSNSVDLVPASITPTFNTQSPSAPPSTPVESPPEPHVIPPVPILPIPVPISTNPAPVVLPPPISVKIADLGNATPSKKHYTEDIQTRQYRAPEAILGRRDWGARVDIWSVACVVFELLTSEFLFDPHGQGERFTKDDDHMAQIIELLGDFPLELKMKGKYSRELFDHTGALRYIHELRPWPLERVMIEKYAYPEADSVALSEFLLPMLAIDMSKRAHARDMLDHPWLTLSPGDEEVVEW